mmetsp:Transcript_2866/g.5812  ORF Transcript_2866/g.5812 Transcript_2866/m.5812 type:complete len:241 (-) Transcript_2866:519-1241(-)
MSCRSRPVRQPGSPRGRFRVDCRGPPALRSSRFLQKDFGWRRKENRGLPPTSRYWTDMLTVRAQERKKLTSFRDAYTPAMAGISIENATQNDTWSVLKMIAKEKLNPIALNMNNFVVAKEQTNGHVVGAGQIKSIGRVGDRDAFELSSIVVDDAYRGQGIGKSIVRQILDVKAPADAEIFLLTVEDREGFYTPFGFQKTSDAPILLSLEKMIGSVVARLVANQGLIIMVLSIGKDDDVHK